MESSYISCVQNSAFTTAISQARRIFYPRFLSTSYIGPDTTCIVIGETPFVYKMAKNYTRSALASKAILVNASGFDSIPSDINTFLAAQRLQQIDSNASLGAVRSGFKAKGTFSGGTLASGIGMIEAGAEDRKLAMDPYALCPSEYLLTVDRSQTSDTDLRFGSSHSRR